MTRGGRVAEEAQGEAHIPAEQASTEHPPRLSSPHEHEGGAGDRQHPAPEGPRAPLGLIGRVGDRETFDALRREGRRARRGAMTVVHVPGAGDVRFAYSVSRKVGTAVVRNKVRRRLRAAARDLDVRSGGLPTGAYLVAVRPEAATSTYAELHRDLARSIAAATGSAAVAEPGSGAR
jgi:ribonuclease P protein component